ncbi:haloacid dehalogenase type II [Salinirubellus salinus]|uniref:Haloacid dehalogenase type II n=1 Tax=Salinirubellus salinus TaxID=1364945 RepID=A0A9E7R958_9EURY|nr:haloacid dehalogenase type II [Salinirubellus salinus]UWM56753.1 haloacid dehalogenase type II [Salinirubellus salinus]
MSFDPDRVETVTFDSYSTIVDVASAVEALEGRVEDPERAADHWRAHSLLYTMVANEIDEYEPFYEMNRHAATNALALFGDGEVDEATRDEVTSVYHDLHVFEDVRSGMDRLADEYDLYVVSNGNPEMLATMVEQADIGDLLVDTVSADEVETFKPHPEIYRHAAGRTGTPIEKLAHVSAGWFDVHGSKHAGMQAVWVNRDGGPFVTYGPRPDLEVESFHELADELGV